MHLRVLEVDFFLTNCRTRIPFRFGINTMTAAPLCTARVRIETQGSEIVEGLSSDLLVPKWFEKDPEKSLADDAQQLIDSAVHAGEMARTLASGSTFSLWHQLYQRLTSTSGQPPLVSGFGVALIERAMMDAACRAAGLSFFDALKNDLFEVAAGEVHPELAGLKPRDWLPPQPAPTIEVRHTVGLVDPLRTEKIAISERVADGLPQSLEENIRTYGLRCFKLKLSGDRQSDLERLREIASVIREGTTSAPRITVDGNEQFQDLGELVALFEDFARDQDGRAFLGQLISIEQPLPRSLTFDADRNRDMDRLRAIAPVLIDEADAGINAFREATRLGYQGISVKNCKGVFQAVLNNGLAQKLGEGFFQSAEDLTNLPVVAVQQDLTTVSTLGLKHVERNGHHYFRGLDHLPAAEAVAALASHPDLYQDTSWGAALKIENGTLKLGSLHRIGYGYDLPIDLDGRTPLNDWVFEEAGS